MVIAAAVAAAVGGGGGGCCCLSWSHARRWMAMAVVAWVSGRLRYDARARPAEESGAAWPSAWWLSSSRGGSGGGASGDGGGGGASCRPPSLARLSRAARRSVTVCGTRFVPSSAMVLDQLAPAVAWRRARGVGRPPVVSAPREASVRPSAPKTRGCSCPLTESNGPPCTRVSKAVGGCCFGSPRTLANRRRATPATDSEGPPSGCSAAQLCLGLSSS